VKKVGSSTSDTVIELYVSGLEASCRVPCWDLRGFSRITLATGESRRVSFTRATSRSSTSAVRVLEPESFRATIGGSQPDARSVALTGQAPLAVECEVAGDSTELPY
jgi:beta-glucosidase